MMAVDLPGSDFDLMQDVYMTATQREAFGRICSAARAIASAAASVDAALDNVGDLTILDAVLIAWGGNSPRESRALENAIAALRTQTSAPAPGGDGMLPDALIPVSDEWYRLCERRFAVDRIRISGNLARAIVDAVATTPQPPSPTAGEASS